MGGRQVCRAEAGCRKTMPGAFYAPQKPRPPTPARDSLRKQESEKVFFLLLYVSQNDTSGVRQDGGTGAGNPPAR